MAEEVLEGRKALVTGGAQGLGAGMAQALAAAGAKVMIGDVQEDAAETAEGIDGAVDAPGRHRRGQLGGRDRATIEQLGGLDILVNNAGIEISGLIVDAQAADLKKMLEVNVLGTALGIKHGLRAMRPDGAAGNGGAIVNISSVAATIAFPGIARLLRHEVGRRPADAGRRVRGRQARLRRPRQLRLPGARADRDGPAARGRHGARSACSRARRRRSAPSSSRPRSGGSARSPTWPTRSSSSPPTRRASSPASACPSTAGWACERWCLARRLPGQGRVAGSRRAVPRPGRRDADLRRRAGPQLARRGRAGRPASGPATRSGSCRPTMRPRSRACSGSPASGRSGARSTRATRPPRTARCWSCSTVSA